MPTITVDGQDTLLDIKGEGPNSILFIHGIGAGAASWELVAQGLPENYRALLLDLPGFGSSARGGFTGDIDDAATFVHHALHSFGQTEPLSIVGHAYGAQVALSFTARFPDHVDHLALLATSGLDHDTTTTLERAASIQTSGWDETEAANWLRSGFIEEPNDEHFAAMQTAAAAPDADLIAGCFISSAKRVFLEDSDLITTPTVLIHGSQDPFVRQDGVHALASRLQSSSLVTLDGGGHTAPIEAPDEVRAELIRFLSA